MDGSSEEDSRRPVIAATEEIARAISGEEGGSEVVMQLLEDGEETFALVPVRG